MSVRAQILNLLQDLQEEFGLTYLFVSHDLGVVEHISDRRRGDVRRQDGRERRRPSELYARPRHPYTEALLTAVPEPDPRVARAAARIVLRGEIADPAKAPPGCSFHPRCRYAEERCRTEVPALREVGGRSVACHFAEQLDLKGVAEPSRPTTTAP